MNATVLEYQAVGKQYRLGEMRLDALKAVSFSIAKGEFTAIVGPSGSGKSTLLHLGAGLDKPSSGQVYLLGRDLTRFGPRELATVRNRELGFVFQSFNLIPVLNVLENIEYPSLLSATARKNRGRAAELLELVGLRGQGAKRPNMLSGGQRQRVAIARALVNNPSIVFADEPTANLDHATGEAIMNLMVDLNRQLGTTFVFSTHDPRIVAMAQRVIQMEDGCLVADSHAGLVGAGMAKQ